MVISCNKLFTGQDIPSLYLRELQEIEAVDAILFLKFMTIFGTESNPTS